MKQPRRLNRRKARVTEMVMGKAKETATEMVTPRVKEMVMATVKAMVRVKVMGTAMVVALLVRAMDTETPTGTTQVQAKMWEDRVITMQMETTWVVRDQGGKGMPMAMEMEMATRIRTIPVQALTIWMTVRTMARVKEMATAMGTVEVLVNRDL